MWCVKHPNMFSLVIDVSSRNCYTHRWRHKVKINIFHLRLFALPNHGNFQINLRLRNNISMRKLEKIVEVIVIEK